MPDLMKRWEVSALGLDQLTQRAIRRPIAGAGEVLIKVDAVSLNYRDGEVITLGMGVPLEFPFVPASDMSGRVVAVGKNVSRFAVADQVVANFIPGWIDGTPLSWTEAPTQGGPIQGLLSEYVVMPADWLVHAPKTLNALEASTLPVAALTAWMALFELGRLRVGQTVVVQGTGGVSLFAIQMAVMAGATVIVISGSDENIARAKTLGAMHAINRSATPEWQSAVLALTGGRGADQILEMGGGASVGRSLSAIAQGGQISVIGFLESDHFSLPILPLLGSRAKIVGISVGSRRALEDMISMIDRKALKPVIDTVFGFDQVPEAFARLSQKTFGKIVVRVSGS